MLIAAAVLHLSLTTAVFIAGRKSVLRGAFDSNGIAVSFASDGVRHLSDAATLAQFLQQRQLHTWFSSPYPFHVKLYSLSLAIFDPLFGPNILSAEPLNLLCYLGILMLVYKLAEEAFNLRAGFIASVIVALWPSLLLHTTQLLKDPLFILSMLALIHVLIRLSREADAWRKLMLYGAVGALITGILWKTRLDMEPVVIATVALGVALLILRQLQLKQFLLPNVVAMSLLVILMAAAIRFLPVYHDREHPLKQLNPVAQTLEEWHRSRHPTLRWWQAGARVGNIRQRFVGMYPASNSQIDPDVILSNNLDLLRYLPRATAIGFFAPFPGMWFESGNSVGRSGRLLGGMDMKLMYCVEALALIGLWQERRRLSVWLLMSIATMGVVALGLVVINVGSLYRLRYLFMVLLIVLAAGGITHLLNTFENRQSPHAKASEA